MPINAELVVVVHRRRVERGSMNGGSGEVVIAIVLKETAPAVHPANPRPPSRRPGQSSNWMSALSFFLIQIKAYRSQLRANCPPIIMR